MRAPSKVILVGGLVAACLWVGGGSGSAQSSADAPAGPSTTAAPVTAPTPAHLSAADAAALKADPDCQPAAVACAWSQCYPLSSKFTSYTSCFAGSCQVTEKACKLDLLQDLYDPARQRSKGAR